MMLKVYCLKDNKAGEFAQPFFAQNDAIAHRLLDSSVNGRKDTDLYLHSSDFELWALGEFDTKTGELKSDVKYLECCVDVRRVE